MPGRLLFVLVLAFSAGACGEGSKKTGEADSDRGKQVYLAQCTSCHNTDPAKAGPVGPPVSGSSRELLEARLLRAGYPPGYAPKRDTTVMPAQPQLAPYVNDLAAYLR